MARPPRLGRGHLREFESRHPDQVSRVLDQFGVVASLGQTRTQVQILYTRPIYQDVAQFGSVLAREARGRRFKSCHPDQFI